MKLTTLEEYGLRCVLQMAKKGVDKSSTIPELARLEALSVPNTAKIMRLLRKAGVVRSQRGSRGGYVLARPAGEISVQEVLDAVGGKFDSALVCERHGGHREACIHHADCSMQSLWGVLEGLIEGVLSRCMLTDLLDPARMRRWVASRVEPALAASRERADVFRAAKEASRG
jgi:Rrf2 family protein